MNAQSSRSHAIFSLTLTQKKFTGSGNPPRSSSPLPPGRSPSRLARPGSMYAGGPSPVANRVASPTSGRPSTPSSFTSALGRPSSLRPASALGHLGERAAAIEEEGGEWVTIVSKFHFVDLAGSERVCACLYCLSVFSFSHLHLAETYCGCWRANQGRYFNQQRSPCTWKRHLRSRRPIAR